MRKISLSLLAVIASVVALAQLPELPKDSAGKITYTAIVEAPSVDLYAKAGTFIASHFTLLREAPERSEFIARYAVPVTYPFLGSDFPGGEVSFNFSLQTKDGKYRYSFSDFVHTSAEFYSWGPLEGLYASRHSGKEVKLLTGYLNQVDEAVNLYVSQLKEAMSAPEVW